MSLSQLPAETLKCSFKIMGSITQGFACPGVASVCLQVGFVLIY